MQQLRVQGVCSSQKLEFIGHRRQVGSVGRDRARLRDLQSRMISDFQMRPKNLDAWSKQS